MPARDHELTELHAIVTALIRGEDPPARFRVDTVSGMKPVRGAYGRRALAVTIIEGYRYQPLVAFALAAFILHGLDWEDPLAAIGITDLRQGLAELERRFGSVTGASIVLSSPGQPQPSSPALVGRTGKYIRLVPPPPAQPRLAEGQPSTQGLPPGFTPPLLPKKS